MLDARERQAARLRGTGAASNAPARRRAGCTSSSTSRRGADRPLAAAYERGQLSARGRDRVLRVARTVADLDGSDAVRRRCTSRTALGFRQDADGAQAA